MENISFFDLAVGVLLIIFGIKGLFSGLIKEVFGLVGIIGGIFVASRYAGSVGDMIDSSVYHISNRSSIYFIGFLVTLLAFWLASILVGFLFTKLVSLSGLGLLNRILGFLVGSLKIFLLFSILIFALRSMDVFRDNIDSKLQNSYIYPYLIKSGNYIVKLKFDDGKKAVQSIKQNISPDNNASSNK